MATGNTMIPITAAEARKSVVIVPYGVVLKYVNTRSRRLSTPDRSDLNSEIITPIK